jgi:hypothetical protein
MELDRDGRKLWDGTGLVPERYGVHGTFRECWEEFDDSLVGV